MAFVEIQHGWIILVELVGRGPRVIVLSVPIPSDFEIHRAFTSIPPDSSIDDMIYLVFVFFELGAGFLIC